VRFAWPKDHALTYDAVITAIDSFEVSNTVEGEVNPQDILLLRKMVNSAKIERKPFLEQQRSPREKKGSPGDGAAERREQQLRFRNSNSMSDADNDNYWRRGSSGGAVPRALENFRNANTRGES